MPPRLILVEGIPGSGKTSLARWLEDRLREEGVPARAVLELDRDHPVIPPALRKTCREPGYALRCARSWADYAQRRSASPHDGIEILEACLLQNTVRLLLEHDHSSGAPALYLERALRAIEPLEPMLVVLRQRDVVGFLRDRMVARKGEAIVERISVYTETTPLARRRGWRGREGMFALYAHYRDVCDALLAGAKLPTRSIDSEAGDWPRVQGEALDFVMERLGGRRGIMARGRER